MQLGKAAADQILTIVHLLAKGADHQRLSPVNTQALNQNVEARYPARRRRLCSRFSCKGKRRHGCAHPACGAEAIAISIAGAGGRDAFCAKLFAVSFCPLQWAAGLFD
jgi:hypothetical protein